MSNDEPKTPEPYKACGAQLRHHPYARGEPFEVWRARQPLCDQKELAEWIRNRQADELKREQRGKKEVRPDPLPEKGW